MVSVLFNRARKVIWVLFTEFARCSDWRWVIFEYLHRFLLLWKSKITVSDRKLYCLRQKSIFQAQIINTGDNLSDTNEIRLNRGDRLGTNSARRNLRSKSIVSVAIFSSNFDHLYNSYSQKIKITDPNIISDFYSYFMVFQGVVERTTWLNKMMTKCYLLIIECSCFCFTIIFSRRFPKFCKLIFNS